jgi:NRAMP (natural resistance-associated macrophage protein)-like metal ion transporter
VLFLMIFWSSERRRYFEIFIGLLVLCVSTCMFILVSLSDPEWVEVVKGFVPSSVLLDRTALYISIGIIGATVMPHNLYLHR